MAPNEHAEAFGWRGTTNFFEHVWYESSTPGYRLMWITMNNSASLNSTPGWTTLFSGTVASNRRLYILGTAQRFDYYLFNLSSTAQVSWAAWADSMIDESNPLLGVQVSSSGSGTSLTAPSVSFSGNAVVYRSFHGFSGENVEGPGAPPLTTPSGIQNRWDLWGGIGTHCSMITRQTASGGVGSTTSTFTGAFSSGWAASTIAFRRQAS